MGIRDSIALRLRPTRIREAEEDLHRAATLYERGAKRLLDLTETVRTRTGWDEISADGVLGRGTESDRLDAVDQSRTIIRLEGTAKWMIRLWSSFGFGSTMNVTVAMEGDEPDLPKAKGPATGRASNPESSPVVDATSEAMLEDDVTPQDWWNEFAKARRNKSILKPRNQSRQSDVLLRDGDFAYIYFFNKYGENAGRGTLRMCYTEQITDVITDPEDVSVTLWYKREWTDEHTGKLHTVYYPNADLLAEARDDSMLPVGAIRADQTNAGVDALMSLVAFDPNDYGRGQPLLMRSIDWINQLPITTADLAAVTAQNAMFARLVKHGGGSRDTKSIKATLQSALAVATGVGNDTNPVPAAGSTWIENEAATVGAMPLNKAGAEAGQAVQLITRLAAIGGGLFPHYIGAGESFRLATASAMEAPVFEQWTQYKMFWEDVTGDLVNVVLNAAQLYGGKGWPEDERIVNVTSSEMWKVDLDQFSEALSMIGDALPKQVRTRLALEAFGVNDIDQILADMEEEPEPPPPPQIVMPAAPVAPEPEDTTEAREHAAALLGKLEDSGELTEAEAELAWRMLECLL